MTPTPLDAVATDGAAATAAADTTPAPAPADAATTDAPAAADTASTPLAFARFDLHPTLVQTVAELGYDAPTPIQEALIPVMLTGQDVVGQAQTGTGKTAAFTLPLLSRLEPGAGAVQALVLVPTRELATQVATAVHTYGRALGVRVLPVFGGQAYQRQTDRLRKGIDVVVATPGRLLDLMNQGALDLSAVSTVVLDEADEMLSMGFADDLEAILQATPAARQTALLSATLPPAIRRLADRYLREPATCTVGQKHGTAAAIEQRYVLVREYDKTAALVRLLETEPVTSALVFTTTRAGVATLAADLQAHGFAAEALSGELTQSARVDVLERFRRGRIQLLVATDVAARGLDIDHVSHVFNYELPRDPEVYVHRVGRTGRAGKTGVAISLVAPHVRALLRRVEAFTRQPMVAAAIPSVEAVRAHRDTQARARVEAQLAAAPASDDARTAGTRARALVLGLLADGHEPLDVAAAAVALTLGTEPELAPIAEVVDRPVREKGTKGGYEKKPYEKKAFGKDRFEKGGYEKPFGKGAFEKGGFDKKGKKPYSKDRADAHGRPGIARQSHEEGMVRLQLNTGRADGVQPGQVVGALAHFGDIPGTAIGKIKIGDDRTFVDVPEDLAGQLIARTGTYRIGKQKVEVERA